MATAPRPMPNEPDIQPEIAAVGIVESATGPGADRHAHNRGHVDRAEPGFHERRARDARGSFLAPGIRALVKGARLVPQSLGLAACRTGV
jgi:hypothetical protein